MAPLLILGYDGRPEARDALLLARCLANLLGAEIRAIWAGATEADTEPGELADDLEISFQSHGSPAQAIHEAAGREAAAMVVLGSGRRAGLGRLLPGGVARRLLHGAPCPVAIAPRGLAERGMQDPLVIAVAYDGSPESRGALKLAADLGDAAHATLRVITVEESAWQAQGVAATAAAGAAHGLQDALHQAVRELPSSLRAEPRFRKDVPVASALIAEAELGVDLLVMGSRGYGPARAVLLGSVSEDVVSAATCPVVIVPRAAAHDGPGPGAGDAA